MSEENQEVQHHQVVGAPWVPAEARYCMIAEAAYFIAERGGFEGNCEAHWLEAGREIDQVFRPAATDSPFLPD